MPSARREAGSQPGERRDTVLDVIRGARHDLVLSLFRCDDFKVLDALASAVERKVRVRALLTPHAKNWDHRLQDLGVFLESMGAEVYRYAGTHSKYHAKYIVADSGPALVASLNFTRKCFQKTCDFILVTHDPVVLPVCSPCSTGLPRARFRPPAGSD